MNPLSPIPEPTELSPSASMKGISLFRHIVAILLAIYFFLFSLSNFVFIKWERTPEGKWLVTETEEISSLWGDAMIGILFICIFLGVMLFIILSFVDLFSFEKRKHSGPIHWTQVAYFFAWSMILTGFFLFFGIVFYVLLGAMGVSEDTWEISLELILGVCTIALALWIFRGNQMEFGWNKPHWKQWLVYLLVCLPLLAFVYFILDTWITEWVAELFSLELSSTREDLITQGIHQSIQEGWWSIAIQVAMIGIVGPLSEEVMFRGVLQSWFVRRLGAWGGILLASFIFALFHCDIPLFVPLFISGLMLGYLRHRFQSLWPAFLLHILNNTLYTVLEYIDLL